MWLPLEGDMAAEVTDPDALRAIMSFHHLFPLTQAHHVLRWESFINMDPKLKR